MTATLSPEQYASQEAHFAYWGELLARGQVVALGPVADPTGDYGIGIVLAPDLDAAEAIRDNDPAMRSPFDFRTEVAPMMRLVTPSGVYDAPQGRG